MILDGTGLFCFKEKHCDNCLCTEKQMPDGKKMKLYYHKVLEAKIVLSDNVVISLGTEFIENEKEDVSLLFTPVSITSLIDTEDACFGLNASRPIAKGDLKWRDALLVAHRVNSKHHI